jgi:transcription antitermination factor NusG
MNAARGSGLQVLKTPGIVGFVGNNTGPLPIPDHQIENIRTVLDRQVECSVHPLLAEGQRVRVLRGALAGVQGKLVRNNCGSRLIISVEMINRSLVVSVSPWDVELLPQNAA